MSLGEKQKDLISLLVRLAAFPCSLLLANRLEHYVEDKGEHERLVLHPADVQSLLAIVDHYP